MLYTTFDNNSCVNRMLVGGKMHLLKAALVPLFQGGRLINLHKAVPFKSEPELLIHEVL